MSKTLNTFSYMYDAVILSDFNYLHFTFNSSSSASNLEYAITMYVSEETKGNKQETMK